MHVPMSILHCLRLPRMPRTSGPCQSLCGECRLTCTAVLTIGHMFIQLCSDFLQDGIAEVDMEDESMSEASNEEEDQAQEPAVKPVSSK